MLLGRYHCTVLGVDGIDRLLQIVAYYRRRQPQSPEVMQTQCKRCASALGLNCQNYSRAVVVR